MAVWSLICASAFALLLAGCTCKPQVATSRTKPAEDSQLEAFAGRQQFGHTSAGNVIDVEEMDIMLTPEEEVKLLHSAHAQGSKSRQKRKIVEKEKKRWPMPIFYKFDHSSTSAQKTHIREALSHWQVQTCLLFFEVQDSALLTTHHIIFTNVGSRCGSFVGMVDLPKNDAQIINLPDKCLQKFGTVVHEIGHALGLWHEHQRPDRDSHVTVMDENLVTWAQGNFDRAANHLVDLVQLPYDYNSVMHYAATAGSTNGLPTLRTRNKLFQRNIGQRIELSFLDSKVINTAYCNNMCLSRRLRRPCLHGGYQDPNQCDRCRCPAGLSGRYCNTVEPSSNVKCGGTIHLGSDKVAKLQSPGYAEGHPYDNKVNCHWLIKAPADHTVELKFLDNFSVYCQKEVCFHWVEVKHQKSFQYPGPRFCCSSRPEQVVESEGRDMLVILKANWTARAEERLGFKAVVHAKAVSWQWGNALHVQSTLHGKSPAGKSPAEKSYMVALQSAKQTTVTTTPTAAITTTTTTTTPAPSTTTTTMSTTTMPPTTTTTTAPSTTTTTMSTTTTAATKRHTTNDILKFSWGPWSSCIGTTNSRFDSCSCGSCSSQTRRRFCGGATCPLRLVRVQHRRCAQKCTQKDAVITFKGGLKIRQCPLCCKGFKPDRTGRCIPKR